MNREMRAYKQGVLVVCKVVWVEEGSKPLQVSFSVKRRRGLSCCSWFKFSRRVVKCSLQETTGHSGNSFTSEPAFINFQNLGNTNNDDQVKICVRDGEGRKHLHCMDKDEFLRHISDCPAGEVIEIALTCDGQNVTWGTPEVSPASVHGQGVEVYLSDQDTPGNDQQECEEYRVNYRTMDEDEDVPAFDLADYTTEWSCSNEVYEIMNNNLETEPWGNNTHYEKHECVQRQGNYKTMDDDDDVPAFDLADYTAEQEYGSKIYESMKDNLNTEPDNETLCNKRISYKQSDIHVTSMDTEREKTRVNLGENPKDNPNKSPMKDLNEDPSIPVIKTKNKRRSFYGIVRRYILAPSGNSFVLIL